MEKEINLRFYFNLLNKSDYEKKLNMY